MMNKDTMQIIVAIMTATVAVIVAIATAAIMTISVNKSDVSELRADMRELRGLLITHIAGHAHAVGEVVAKVDNVEAVKE
ncbi:MAG: hypothetical protein ACR2PV_09190 [Gammaproteobacteria bacterium]